MNNIITLTPQFPTVVVGEADATTGEIITVTPQIPTVSLLEKADDIISLFSGVIAGDPGRDGRGLFFITAVAQVVTVDSIAILPVSGSNDLMYRALTEQLGVTTSTDFTDTDKWRPVGIPATHDHDLTSGYIKTVEVEGTALTEDNDLAVNVTRSNLGLGDIATHDVDEFAPISHTSDTTVHITSSERTKWNTASDEAGTALQSDDVETFAKDTTTDIPDDKISSNIARTTQLHTKYTNAEAVSANATAISVKVDKVSGKELSDNNFSDSQKTVLNDIQDFAKDTITEVPLTKIPDAIARKNELHTKFTDNEAQAAVNVRVANGKLLFNDATGTAQEETLSTGGAGTHFSVNDARVAVDISASENTLSFIDKNNSLQTWTPSTGSGEGGSFTAADARDALAISDDGTTLTYKDASDQEQTFAPTTDLTDYSKFQDIGIRDVAGVDSVIYHSGVQFDDEADVITTLLVNSPIDNTTEKVHITMYVISTNIAEINSTTFTVTWGGVSRTFTLNLGYFSQELTFTGLTNPSTSSLTISKNEGGSLGANIKVVLDHSGTVVVTPATVQYLNDNYFTWDSYAVGGQYDSDYTESNGSETIKLQFGGANNYVYRNIIDSPYTDVIYSDAALTTELTRRGA